MISFAQAKEQGNGHVFETRASIIGKVWIYIFFSIFKWKCLNKYSSQFFSLEVDASASYLRCVHCSRKVQKLGKCKSCGVHNNQEIYSIFLKVNTVLPLSKLICIKTIFEYISENLWLIWLKGIDGPKWI